MDKIMDHLYLGDIQGASNMLHLKRNGITHILQAAAGFKPFFPGEFNYMVINILDMPFENILRHLKSAVDFIKQAIKSGGNVLVHCYAGISRSATCVIAYLMKEHGLPMYDAMTYSRKRRPIVFPNPGFQRQLMEYEKHIKAAKQQQEINQVQDQQKKKLEQQQQQALLVKQQEAKELRKRQADTHNEQLVYKTGGIETLYNNHRHSVSGPSKKLSLPSSSNNTVLQQQNTQKHSSTKHQFFSPPPQQQIQPTLTIKQPFQDVLERAQTQQIALRKQQSQVPTLKNSSFKGGSSTMQSSYARDFSLKPMNAQNEKTLKNSDQRSTTLIQQVDIRGNSSKPAQAVSQQYFYQQNATPVKQQQQHQTPMKPITRPLLKEDHAIKPPLGGSSRLVSSGNTQQMYETPLKAKMELEAKRNTYQNKMLLPPSLEQSQRGALWSPQSNQQKGIEGEKAAMMAVNTFDHRASSHMMKVANRR